MKEYVTNWIAIMLTGFLMASLWTFIVHTQGAPRWAEFVMFGIIYNMTVNHVRGNP